MSTDTQNINSSIYDIREHRFRQFRLPVLEKKKKIPPLRQRRLKTYTTSPAGFFSLPRPCRKPSTLDRHNTATKTQNTPRGKTPETGVPYTYGWRSCLAEDLSLTLFTRHNKVLIDCTKKGTVRNKAPVLLTQGHPIWLTQYPSDIRIFRMK